MPILLSGSSNYKAIENFNYLRELKDFGWRNYFRFESIDWQKMAAPCRLLGCWKGIQIYVVKNKPYTIF